MEKFALIVAGGTGSRMGSDIPKQFLDLAGKPVLMRTMERFAAYDPQIKIVLVLSSAEFGRWNELCSIHGFTMKHLLVEGGSSRFQSVKNGLTELPDEGLVFIHDGVRPLVSGQTIDNCERMTMSTGNALPVMPVAESLRERLENCSRHVDRSRFCLVQTPQTFRVDMIKQAYLAADNEFFTDDASVCEAFGETINLVDGNPENIKITRSVDLYLAECLFPLMDGETRSC